MMKNVDRFSFTCGCNYYSKLSRLLILSLVNYGVEIVAKIKCANISEATLQMFLLSPTSLHMRCRVVGTERALRNYHCVIKFPNIG